MGHIQGHVKGVKLCLIPSFFDWLEKRVGWLLKYSLHVENKRKDFWNKVSLLSQDLALKASIFHTIFCRPPFLAKLNSSCNLQSLLFLRPDDRNGSGGTLSGNKKSVYILLKILKLLRNGSITSFTLKYATDRGLEEVVYETAALGPSLQRVLRLDVNWIDIWGKTKVLQKERNFVSDILTFIFNMERVVLQPANSLLQPAKKVRI